MLGDLASSWAVTSRAGWRDMTDLRVGVVGAGHIAEVAHLPALAAIGGATVVGVAEPSAERRAVVAAAWPGVPTFESAEDLVGTGSVDALVVCSPPVHHRAAALLAFEAGLHLYLEKPIAAAVEDGQAIVDAWRDSARVAAVGFNYRFHPAVQELRRRLAAGEIGRRVAMNTVFSVPMDDASMDGGPGWRRSAAAGGGAVLELGSHHFDLIGYLTGESIDEVVAATLTSRRWESDTADVSLRLSDGTAAHCTFALGAGEIDRIEILGESGALMMDRNAGEVSATPSRFEHGRVAALRRGVRAAAAGLARLAAGTGEPSYRAALSAFVRAAGGEPVEVPGLEAGLRSLRVADAVLRVSRGSGPLEAP